MKQTKFAGKYASSNFRPKDVIKSVVVDSVYVRDGSNHKSLPSINTCGHSTARVIKQYTGSSIVGIATMHKSNAVPVFSKDEAVSISSMRRG